MTKLEIMGVLNITPDSFSDGGRFNSVQTAFEQAKLLVSQGATVLDVGGESTRPGATRVSIEEELARVIPVIEAIKNLGAAISIDTMNAETAAAAVAAGASIINDVSGGKNDPEIFKVAADTNSTFIVSHWRGHSTEMDRLNNYQDIVEDVTVEIAEQVAKAKSAGIKKLVIDPGLGFAKNAEQNWKLLRGRTLLQSIGLPVLYGTSRKRFIAEVLGPDATTESKDQATAVLNAMLAGDKNVWGFRVHNVKATMDALSIRSALNSEN